jgi:hypothetical protein
MDRRQKFWSGVAALLALIVGTLGVPFVLLAVAGSPIPSSLPQIHHVHNVLSKPLSDGQIIGGLAVICWVVWLAFAISVLTEVFGWLRGIQTPNVPITGGLARRLVIAAAVLFATSTQRPVTPLSQQLSPIAITINGAGSPLPLVLTASTETSTQSSPTISYTVVPRDDLWTLAQNHLGDPYRWRELFQLNKGVLQGDGEALQSPELLRPGWVLQFPGDATGIDSPAVGPAPFNGPTTVNEEPPPPGPNVTYTDTPTSTTSTSITSTQSEAPTATEPSGDTAAHQPPFLKMGLLASGTVFALDQVRRRRRRHRQPGTLSSELSDDLMNAEVSLRFANETSNATRLDTACRALAHCFATASQPVDVRVDAVRISDNEVEFLLNSAVNSASGPFRVDSQGFSWTLSSSVHDVRVGAFAAEMASPLPALVHIGSLDGSDVLIDLESHGVTSITGEHRLAVGHTVLEQLATSVWADHIEVIVVGLTVPIGLERVRTANQIEEIPSLSVGVAKSIRDTLREEGIPTTFQGRATQEPNDGFIPTVVVLPADLANGTAFDELIDVAGDGGQGLAVVILGDYEGAQRKIIADLGCTSIDPPELELTSLPVDDRAMSSIAELLDQATSNPEIEYQLPEMPIDLREMVDLPPLPPVSVNVLGDVEIVGGQEEIDRSRSIEAVAYLALHRNGATDDKLKAALWPKPPTPGTFNTTISLARRQLGQDQDGIPYVLPVRNGRYMVSDAVGSDLDRFECLFAMAKSAPEAQAIRLLSGALELVRGKPFDDTRTGYAWAHTEGFIARAEALVADAAHALAQLHLQNGDAARATWAARKGLLASPGYEVLYRDLMFACEIDGNLAALETIMAELNALLDAVDPSDNLESETTELYKRLRQRRAPASAR